MAATNPDTEFTRETLSNSVGVYSDLDVLPGTYTGEVSAPGLQTYKRTGLTVSVQALTRIDVAMSAGTTKTITVLTQTADLQTDRMCARTSPVTHSKMGSCLRLWPFNWAGEGEIRIQ